MQNFQEDVDVKQLNIIFNSVNDRPLQNSLFCQWLLDLCQVIEPRASIRFLVGILHNVIDELRCRFTGWIRVADVQCFSLRRFCWSQTLKLPWTWKLPTGSEIKTRKVTKQGGRRFQNEFTAGCAFGRHCQCCRLPVLVSEFVVGVVM